MHREIPPFARRRIEVLAAAMPGDQPAEDKVAAAEAALESCHSADAAEAALVAVTIAMAEAAMDSLARAARPGMSDDTAIRLRNNAMAAARACTSLVRALRPRPSAAREQAVVRPASRRVAATRPSPSPEAPTADTAPAEPAGPVPPAPGSRSIPPVELFEPRDRSGKPIPHWREDLMTPAQFRAAYAVPRDPALEAVAVAEEAAMQAALQATEHPAAAAGIAGGAGT